MTKYIQLNRRFVEFRAASDEDDSDISFSRWHASSEGKTWQDVLGDPCSVIIGEGGTGKTEEFRQQALALRVGAKPAFLCRLEMLAELPLKSALEIGRPEEVQAWFDSDEHAYFFLDSVDEAKLVSARTFEAAIIRFAEAIKAFARRTTIVISTRPHAWQAFSDRDLVCRLLELVPSSRTNDTAEGDESEATVLQRVADEIELRRSLANKLRQAAHGKYTIASEEELANQDRTDIRLHNPAVEGRIPIELKIAGQWTVVQLSERLENQLIRQYMKEARFGIFLVVNRGSAKDTLSWDVSGKHRQPFSELIKWLAKEALRLANKHKANVQGLEIVGVDLLKRYAGKVSKRAVAGKGSKKRAAKSSARARRQPRGRD